MKKSLIFSAVLFLAIVGVLFYIVKDKNLGARSQYGRPGIYNATAINLTDSEGAALAVDSSGHLIMSTTTSMSVIFSGKITPPSLGFIESLLVINADGTATTTINSSTTSTFYKSVDLLGATSTCFSYGGKCATPRWIFPLHGGAMINNAVASTTANTVYLSEFQVEQRVVFDAVCYVQANSTSTADNVIVGIYGPIVTEETSNGSPLLVKSSTSTATTSASTPVCITFIPTLANPGRYYAAILSPDSVISFWRVTNSQSITGWTQTFTVSSGQSLPSTPGTLTNTVGAVPGMKIRTVNVN